MRQSLLSLHLIAIISWMAGILYLYRLLIYLREKGPTHAEIRDLLSLMARRLYRFITVPAMVVSWIAGIALIALQPAYLQQGWLHGKLLAVSALTLATAYAGTLVRRMTLEPSHAPSSRNLRILNEVPTLLMIAIVLLVIFRPF